jgi:hypothetical protein
VGECCVRRKQDQRADGSMPKSGRQKKGWIKKKHTVRDYQTKTDTDRQTRLYEDVAPRISKKSAEMFRVL